jgi:signal transduction histidine kinase
MTALLAAAAAAAFAAAALAALHARRSAQRRDDALRRCDEMRAASRTTFGLVAHEMKSPLSAVLGYQELMAEGLYGPLDPRVDEAVRRIGSSARQLVVLADGMTDLGAAAPASTDRADVDLAAEIRDSLAALESDIAARSISARLEIDGDPVLATDPLRFRRCLDLCLSAAVKTSAGRELLIRLDPDPPAARIRIAGSGIDPRRDDPAERSDGTVISGAGLRLAMAAAAARPAGIGVHIGADGTLEIRVGPAPAGSRGPRRPD